MKKWNAKTIKTLRLELGWTSSDLARRLGCSLEVLSKIESHQVEIDKEIQAQLDALENIKNQSCQALSQRSQNDSEMQKKNIRQLNNHGIEDNIENKD